MSPLALSALILAPSARAQTPPPRSRHAVSASLYLHQLTHPGGQVGYRYDLLRTDDGAHALVVGAELGGYVWPRHSFGAFVLPHLGYRARTRGGFQAEVNLHAGYLQGVLASESFAVVDGNVVPSGRAGFPYFYVGPTAGVGYAIPRSRVTPFVRVGVHWQLPVFDQSLMRLVAAAGVEVSL